MLWRYPERGSRLEPRGSSVAPLPLIRLGASMRPAQPSGLRSPAGPGGPTRTGGPPHRKCPNPRGELRSRVLARVPTRHAVGVRHVVIRKGAWGCGASRGPGPGSHCWRSPRCTPCRKRPQPSPWARTVPRWPPARCRRSNRLFHPPRQ
jgi:hypothetical protein